MALDLVSIKRPTDIKNNVGGIAENFWISRVDKFLAFQGPQTTHTTLGDSTKITTDHTFDVADGWITMQLDYQQNMFEGVKVGDWGSSNREYTIKGVYHGLNAEIAEIVRELQNTELAILVQKLNPAAATPQMVQFGIPTMFARLDDYKETSGTSKDGYNGYEFTFKAVQPNLYFYEGAITLKP